MHIGGIFCGLAKAFGCVTQKILLAKLRFCGIQGVSADWFRPYLTARKQNGERKSPYATWSFFSDGGTLKKCGVRQGWIRIYPFLLII